MNSVASPAASTFNEVRPESVLRLPWWNPMAYLSRALPAALEALIAGLNIRPDGAVLDFGCANLPYRHCFPPSVQYLGADLAGNPKAALTINKDGTLAVESERFDLVLSSQVLEHVGDPAVYLAECYRTLRPGGRLLLSTHGIMIYHPDPVDYWRWTGAGLCLALERAGFKVQRLSGIMGLAATGLQMFLLSTWPSLPRGVRAGYSVLMQALIAWSDRWTSDRSRTFNALVFAVVAEKPAVDRLEA